MTDDGKQGSCESDDISVGAASYALSYSVQYKNSTQTSFTDFAKTLNCKHSAGAYKRVVSKSVGSWYSLNDLQLAPLLPCQSFLF